MSNGAALVTGGAGFIGSHIVETFRAQGRHVEALDNLSAGRRGNLPADVPLHIADIRSPDELRRVFSASPFDVIFHCAAQTSVERSMLDPDLDQQINVAGTRHLLAAAKASGVRRFVFLSSGGAIYGETSAPATERTLPAPRSFYGFHKYAAEQLIRTDDVPYVVLRPSNVYGPRQRSDVEGGVVAIFLERLLAGRPIEIHGDGRQLRDFVHVSDVVAAALLALEVEPGVVWNVASDELVSVLDLAGAVSALTHQPARYVECPRRAGDIDRSALTASLLRATGRWGPPLPLAAGLRFTLPDAARHVGTHAGAAGSHAGEQLRTNDAGAPTMSRRA